jgi:hypothetical protein
MIMRLMNELYGGEEAMIQVDGSPEQAAGVLKGRTSRWRGLTLMDTVVGAVTVDHVVLRVSHRALRNAFAPIFRGRFTAMHGRTYLTGSFGLRRSAQVFATVWFCSIGLFCLVAIVIGVGAAAQRGAASWVAGVVGALSALPGLALGLLGIVVVRIEKRPSRSDIGQIVEHVRSAYGENVV